MLPIHCLACLSEIRARQRRAVRNYRCSHVSPLFPEVYLSRKPERQSNGLKNGPSMVRSQDSTPVQDRLLFANFSSRTVSTDWPGLTTRFKPALDSDHISHIGLRLNTPAVCSFRSSVWRYWSE